MTTPEEAVRGARETNQKCATCGLGDALFMQAPCPDGIAGCLVWHGRPVPCVVCAFAESKLTAERSRLAARSEMFRVPHDATDCSQCDKGAPCDTMAGNYTLDAVLALLREGA